MGIATTTFSLKRRDILTRGIYALGRDKCMDAEKVAGLLVERVGFDFGEAVCVARSWVKRWQVAA